MSHKRRMKKNHAHKQHQGVAEQPATHDAQSNAEGTNKGLHSPSSTLFEGEKARWREMKHHSRVHGSASFAPQRHGRYS